MFDPTQLPAWKTLQAHFNEVAPLHMRNLFREDPGRFGRFSLRFQDILLDFSKNRITEETIKLLVQLAEESGMTLVGFLRGSTMNVYAGEQRVST